VLSLAEALDKLENNQLPPRAVCITFDDGYADNYLNALPILKENKLQATFFIASGYLNGGIMWNDKVIEAIRCCTSDTLDLTSLGLGCFDIDSKIKKAKVAQQIINKIKHLDSEKRQEIADNIAGKVDNLPTDLMLTNEQLIQLHQAEMEIGGHTVTHPILSKLDHQNVEFELQANKTYLEQLLMTTIRFFAYPNGKLGVDFNPEHAKQVRDLGYQAAVSTDWGVANNRSDVFRLPRFTPWDTQPVKFMLRMIHRYIVN
jgi:peptidoglycan/xylan/chitin deacetylase (PgdA/CDA1 family)